MKSTVFYIYRDSFKFDENVLCYLEAHNSAGHTRSPDIVIEPPDDKSPFGPLSTSEFIAILIGGLCGILLLIVLMLAVPAVCKRLQTSSKTKETLGAISVNHFDYEVQAIVSYNHFEMIISSMTLGGKTNYRQ